MEHISPSYKAQLQELAKTLVTPERFASVAQNIGQLALVPEIPPHIRLAEE